MREVVDRQAGSGYCQESVEQLGGSFHLGLQAWLHTQVARVASNTRLLVGDACVCWKLQGIPLESSKSSDHVCARVKCERVH